MNIKSLDVGCEIPPISYKVTQEKIKSAELRIAEGKAHEIEHKNKVTAGKYVLKSEEEVKEPETEIERKLTAIDVEDIIMAKYCDLMEDPEYAMAIIREQFKRAEVDFREPSTDGLLKVVEFIINAASDQVEASRLQREKKAYSDLIRLIEKR